MFRRFVRPHYKNLKTVCIFLIMLHTSKSGVTRSCCRQIWDVCGNTFFTCWRSAICWNSVELVTENSKWDALLLLEYELGWTAFLTSGIPQKWISKEKRLKNDFQGQPADLQQVKNVLPHTSQICWHQLPTTPLDWSMMRNIHSLQIFTVWSHKHPEHSLLGSLFQCYLKKKTKTMGP